MSMADEIGGAIKRAVDATYIDVGQLQRDNAALRAQLSLMPFVCGACWTSSFAPCEEGTPDAEPDPNSDGWIVCQQCQVVGWNHALRERVEELERERDEAERALQHEVYSNHDRFPEACASCKGVTIVLSRPELRRRAALAQPAEEGG